MGNSWLLVNIHVYNGYINGYNGYNGYYGYGKPSCFFSGKSPRNESFSNVKIVPRSCGDWILGLQLIMPGFIYQLEIPSGKLT